VDAGGGADSPVRGYAHVIRKTCVNPNLLFLGTELGLWVSVDGGKQWAHYKGGDLRPSRCAISRSIARSSTS